MYRGNSVSSLLVTQMGKQLGKPIEDRRETVHTHGKIFERTRLHEGKQVFQIITA